MRLTPLKDVIFIKDMNANSNFLLLLLLWLSSSRAAYTLSSSMSPSPNNLSSTISKIINYKDKGRKLLPAAHLRKPPSVVSCSFILFLAFEYQRQCKANLNTHAFLFSKMLCSPRHCGK